MEPKLSGAYSEGMKDSIIGKFYLAFLNGKLDEKGEVLEEVGPYLFKLQMISWADGRRHPGRLLQYHQMSDWKFFNTQEQMDKAAEELFQLYT